MNNWKVIIVWLACISFSVNSQEDINWMEFKEAFELSRDEPKKIMVDVYTDWCGWCKVMDKNTFNHPEIAKYVNDTYYPVKLNAEMKEDITIGDVTYKYVSNGSRGYHELAAALLNGKLSYPSVVFLDEKVGILYPLQGFVKPRQFDEIMRFYGEDHYKDISWDEFLENYNSKIE